MMSCEEVGDRLGISKNSVSTITLRAFKKIRAKAKDDPKSRAKVEIMLETLNKLEQIEFDKRSLYGG